VIIDNGQSGTSYTGTWYVSGGAGFYGTNSLWARNGATYTWSMSSQPAGNYEVFMWWTAYSSRASAINAVVNHAAGQQSLTINQQLNGGQWNSLGTYNFNGAGSVTIRAANGSTISTCADAVWFKSIGTNQPPNASILYIAANPSVQGRNVYFRGKGNDSDGAIAAYKWQSNIDGVVSDQNAFLINNLSIGTHTITFSVQDNQGAWSQAAAQTLTITTPVLEYIIDNGGSGTSYTGNWQISGAAGYYGANSLWSYNGATYSWQFIPTEPGEYRISMWWTLLPSRSNAIPISFEGITSSITSIDQTKNGGKWNDLGQYSLSGNAEFPYKVTIKAPAGSPPSTCADAVKVTYLAREWLDLVIAPIPIIISIKPNPANVGEPVTFEGVGYDPEYGEEGIKEYSWYSYTDGQLSDQKSFTTSSLSAGTHEIRFEVADWDYEGSYVIETLVIRDTTNTQPIATIDSITPNPAMVGEVVGFTGSGADNDGTIVAYRWESNINGVISDEASFDLNLLSPGSHTISFKVRDDKGSWSEPVRQILTINSESTFILDNDGPGTSYTGWWHEELPQLDQFGPDTLYSTNDGSTYNWPFTPLASGRYDLYLWWSVRSPRSNAVHYTFEHDEGTSEVIVNQRENGGKWNSMGTHLLTQGKTYNVKVTVSPSYTTNADAIKWSTSRINNIPQAEIISVLPNPADINQPVEFCGAGFDNDGIITAYEWTSSIDGVIGSKSTFYATNILSAGTHTISLRVKDDNGIWSPNISTEIHVINSQNILPIAVVDLITPNPANYGEAVQFTGHGTDSDGTIKSYYWESSIDGYLANTSSFSDGELSEGTHTISFKVQDDKDQWSLPVTKTLTINPEATDIVIDNGDLGTSFTGTWQVSGAANPYGTNSLWSYSGATYIWTFKPTRSGNYDVFMWWTALSSRSMSVPLSIQHSSGTAYRAIDQTKNGGKWNYLGTGRFNAGSSYNVKITASKGSPPSTCADAVRFLYKNP
jgi:hypothetical protein